MNYCYFYILFTNAAKRAAAVCGGSFCGICVLPFFHIELADKLVDRRGRQYFLK